jgi:branched-chain amino acid transport system permease protein
VTAASTASRASRGLPGLDSYTAAYYVAAAALVVACWAVLRLYEAPLGVLWGALAHNERRVVLFGFDTNRLKAVAFGVSGLLAGIGGALYAPQQGLVTPQLCGFVLSADLVIWAAVGGRGACSGRCWARCSSGALTSVLRDTFRFWEIAIALVFIGVVLVYPQGLIGVLAPLERRFGTARRRDRHRRPARPDDRGAAAPATSTASRCASAR